jgi:EAL and modified HD-GYP domain-containing signal transduction protein
MTQSVLGSLTLGYRLGWNRQRELAAVELFVDAGQEERVDAAHLLRTLRELWAGTSPDLLLALPSTALLADLLDHADAHAPFIEVHQHQLADVSDAVQAAHARGVRLLWRGASDQTPEPPLAACFVRGLISLTVEDALSAWQAGDDPRSPVAPNQLYESVPSRALMQRCLDDRGAHAILGWPAEDTLHRLAHDHLPPSVVGIQRLLLAVDRDASMDVLERVLGQDPVLAYRFMQGISSAAMGLRDGVDTLKHGLMMMGYSGLATWLQGQRAQAHDEADLQPVMASMVLRAELMTHLLDAGVDHELSQEMRLCGLFSQLDVLMREPLRGLLTRIHLPERVRAALLDNTGPYAPYLDIARALEQPDTLSTQLLCEEHGLGLEDVNRGLLRVLAATEVPISRARLG